MLACIFPFVLTVLGVSNSAPKGVVPQSVVISFYVGAVVLIICSLFTILKVKEYSPAEFAAYHGIPDEATKENVNVLNCFATLQRFLDGHTCSIFLLDGLSIFMDIRYRCSR